MTTKSLWMRRMFDSAAGRYVLSNRILTFNQDEKWRKAAADAIPPQTNLMILDICTGTADLALRIAKKFQELTIYALDYSSNMLSIARKRAGEEGMPNIIFRECDCSDTGFENGYFDYVTCSFGFRNLSHSQENLSRVLDEIHRILKKDGRFLILETSQPENGIMRGLFHFYAAKVVPRVGRLFSGKKEPYAYLGYSIVRFFNKEKLISTLESSGFKKELTTSFMFGAVLLCVVKK